MIGLVAEAGSSHCDVSALNPLGFAVADPAAPDAAAEEAAEPDAAGAADELPAAGAELAAAGPELAADATTPDCWSCCSNWTSSPRVPAPQQ